MSNSITAFFKGRVGVAEAVYQNDYGIVMNLDSIELPAHFDCYFSTLEQDEAIPGIGADNQVAIPNDCLTRAGNVTLHIPLHTGTNDSEVEYIVYFKVIGRARPVDDGTPVQMTAIEKALALLQNPINNVEQIVNEALSFTGQTFDEMQAAIDDIESNFTNVYEQFQNALGALTIDSEVQNIRVGANFDENYPSAGEAVRKQVSNLKNGTNRIEKNLANVAATLKAKDEAIHFYLDPMRHSFKLRNHYMLDQYGNYICDYEDNKIISPVYEPTLADEIESLKYATGFHYEQYDLPIVHLSGDMSGISKDNKVNLNYQMNAYYGECKLKWQGASSLAYPKKNFTITLDKPRTIVAGWGAQKKYVLKANWIDFSHLRNIISANIWGQTVRYRPRDYYYLLNNANGDRIADTNGNRIRVYNDPLLTAPNYGAINGFPVSLVINGEYQGLYSMNIPKDGWMMFMEGNEDGAIISAEGGDYIATQFKGLSAPIEDETDFSLEYATNEEDISWITDSLNTAIQAVLDNMRNPDFYDAVNPYLDVQSALDYMIFSAITCNVDGVGRNYLLSTFDKVQWRFTAYDLDSTFGNEPYGKFFYDPVTRATMLSTKYANNAFGIIYDNAKPMLIQRYKELRKGALSDNYITTTLYNYQARIPEIFYSEEQKLWTEIPSTRANNIEQMINFLIQHAHMLDEEMSNLEKSLA